MLSAACKYGIRSAIYLAQADGNEFITVHAISAALGIPKHFLAKIVRRLAQHDLLKSQRGHGGGVTLARSPDQIALVEIVLALDEKEPLHYCLIGLPGCVRAGRCPFHERWSGLHELVHEVYIDMTLDDLARLLHASGTPLSSGGRVGEIRLKATETMGEPRTRQNT